MENIHDENLEFSQHEKVIHTKLTLENQDCVLLMLTQFQLLVLLLVLVLYRIVYTRCFYEILSIDIHVIQNFLY